MCFRHIQELSVYNMLLLYAAPQRGYLGALLDELSSFLKHRPVLQDRLCLKPGLCPVWGGRGWGRVGAGFVRLWGGTCCTCFPYLSPPAGTVWHFLCSRSCSGVFMNLWQMLHSNMRVIRWICRCRSYIGRVLHTKLQKTHSKPKDWVRKREKCCYHLYILCCVSMSWL